jgi:predicted esterase YcpF (UPF0227 family)
MILYLHGLNSAGTAGKATTLQREFGVCSVISPTYPAYSPHQAVAQLTELMSGVEEPEQVIIVGSSMGGFYGQYLARLFPIKHLMMINPALHPWQLLESAVGPQQNFVTGEHYQLTHEMVEATRQYAIDKIDDGVATTLFLDRGDETIDYRIAAEVYRGIGGLCIFEGGDHRFQHMKEAVAIIRNYLE